MDALFTVMLSAMIADVVAIRFLGDKPFPSGFPAGITLRTASQLCHPRVGEAGQVRDAHRGERTWISSVALAAAPGSAPALAGSRTAARRR